MQGIYQQIKAAHPTVKLGVIWSGEISKAARKNDPNRTFTDGLCDICLVNLKAFQEDPRASEKDGIARLQQSVQVLQQVDPTAEIWSSAQVWAPEDGGRRGFRVPEPAEMEALLCTVNADQALTGFLWASWTLPLPGIHAIADSELTPQREAVQSSYQSCIARP